MECVESKLLFQQGAFKLLKTVIGAALFLGAIGFALPIQSIYIENQTGQRIRMHIIARDGFELTRDWLVNETYPYAYASQPLFMSVYGYETKECTQFCSIGSSAFNAITLGTQGGCIAGKYKNWQGHQRATGSYTGNLTRKACISNCWNPLREAISIRALEAKRQQMRKQRQTKPARQAPAQMQTARQRGRARPKVASPATEEAARGLRITNRTDRPIKLRIFTSDCNEIFLDIGQNGENRLEPDRHPINLTVYPKTGTIAPCFGFPGIAMDASFDNLAVNGSGQDIFITYSQSALGINAPKINILPNPNYSRGRGWDSNTQEIFSSALIPANLPPRL